MTNMMRTGKRYTFLFMNDSQSYISTYASLSWLTYSASHGFFVYHEHGFKFFCHLMKIILSFSFISDVNKRTDFSFGVLCGH